MTTTLTPRLDRPGAAVSPGLGGSPVRPDARAKVRGQFEYASDLHDADMLWGATLRCPHPHAAIRSIDVRRALALDDVHAVLTAADLPGQNRHGLERLDQPVLAEHVACFHGEPVAVVAAEHPEAARRALETIVVEYDVLDPLFDAWAAAFDPTSPRVHPEGNIVRHIPVRRGNLDAARARSSVVVSGEYEVGMQDQAFLGPEAGLARPLPGGGVQLLVATQWVHLDRIQIARALDLPLDKVHVTLSGVGGAFGGREDLSVHVHACLLAIRTGRPVKMTYDRLESFSGHVHRHPARMRYEHGASEDGRLQYVEACLVLDGGPYASCSPEVIFNVATFGVGPYEVQAVHTDSYAVFTNNPVCGAMRGFGAVQVAVGYEAQMDKLAGALGMDPVVLRQRNALRQGARMPTTGQRISAPAPVTELLQRVKNMPLPPPSSGDLRSLPGGVGNTTHGEGVRRGVGYAVGFKNVAFGEGSDDVSSSRVHLELRHGTPVATVHSAAAEVGQGLVGVLEQIVREELGDVEVELGRCDASLADAGPTSASRQTYMSGGATKMACEQVRRVLLARAEALTSESASSLMLLDQEILDASGARRCDLRRLLGDGPIDETAEHHHRPTRGLDPATGRSERANLQFQFCAHRAVVDVDVELGLIKVVCLDAAQDVGRAVNPEAIEGQVQGGGLQGMGLAVMEECLVSDGVIRNPSFTDYLIPTILDSPTMAVDILECPDPEAPYGLRGLGEAPTVSSPAAVAAAVRAATGRELAHLPIRVDDICLNADDNEEPPQ